MFQLPLFGDLAFEMSHPGSSLSVGLNALMTGLIEELPFRGIVLYTFLRLWGDTRKGIMRAVEIPGFSETTGALGMIVLLQVPLVAFGAYLILKAPPRQVVPQAS